MDSFQGYVPYVRTKKRSKVSIKSVIAGILFFLFLGVIFACLVYFRKVEKCYEKQAFYVVYVAKNKRKIDTDSIDLVKKLGGAGTLLFLKEEYYLVANVYTKESDAKEIAGGLTATFADAGVVKLEHKSISKNKASHIAQNLSYSKYFEKMYKFLEKYEAMQMKYMTGEYDDGEFLTDLLGYKLDFESIVSEFENPDEEKLFDDIKTYAKMSLNYFDDFYDEFFQNTKKESLVCALGYNLVKLKVDMFDNLQ